MSPEQSTLLANLLSEYSDVFAEDEFDLGSFTSIEHTIDTGDAKPIKQGIRRTPACFVGEEEDVGRWRYSTLPNGASTPVLIRKLDNTVRWCFDYRALNNLTVKGTFPLLLVEDCLDSLSGNVWFSKLDANSAYWQVRIKPEYRK